MYPLGYDSHTSLSHIVLKGVGNPDSLDRSVRINKGCPVPSPTPRVKIWTVHSSQRKHKPITYTTAQPAHVSKHDEADETRNRGPGKYTGFRDQQQNLEILFWEIPWLILGGSGLFLVYFGGRWKVVLVRGKTYWELGTSLTSNFTKIPRSGLLIHLSLNPQDGQQYPHS